MELEEEGRMDLCGQVGMVFRVTSARLPATQPCQDSHLQDKLDETASDELDKPLSPRP